LNVTFDFEFEFDCVTGKVSFIEALWWLEFSLKKINIPFNTWIFFSALPHAQTVFSKNGEIDFI
jgi:hypothetical protein